MAVGFLYVQYSLQEYYRDIYKRSLLQTSRKRQRQSYGQCSKPNCKEIKLHACERVLTSVRTSVKVSDYNVITVFSSM